MIRHRPPLRASRFVAALMLLLTSAASAATVAYYRFETGPDGKSLGSSNNRSIRDTSGNARHLSPFRNPAASAEVPAASVPQTGERNTHSVRLNGDANIYATAGDALSCLRFTHFTIEAWIKFDALDGWQTFIGRDDAGDPGEGPGGQSLFYFSKADNLNPGPDPDIMPNGFRVELVTSTNELLSFNSPFSVTAHTWYHVAVVGDATSGLLTLYVDGAEVGGTSGFTGLFTPAQNTPWTFGRGQYKGKPMDHFIGSLDEVRFSDQALSPSQFLNAPPAKAASATPASAAGKLVSARPARPDGA